MPKTSGQQLTPKTESLPADAFAGTGSGFENVTASDLLIPRLTILQGLSPQVSQGRPEFDPKARVGMIYDVGLQQCFEGAVVFLPVHYNKVWLEWAPRSSGKGLIATHDTSEILKQTRADHDNRATLDNGNYIVETAQLYGLNTSAGWRKSFIPMSSTQLKKVRRLLTLAMSEKLPGTNDIAPLYYRTYELSTVPEGNARGNWMGWKVERGRALPEFDGWREIVEDVKAFRAMLLAGEARGDLSERHNEDEGRAHDEGGAM